MKRCRFSALRALTRKDQTTRKGLPDLRVEAWNRSPENSDLLGQALNNMQGNFIIILQI